MTFSKYEVFLNFSIWTGAVFYSLYSFYLACEIFSNIEDTYNDFTPGWFFLGRKKESADIEWQTILYLLFKIYPWCFLHICISQVTLVSTNNYSIKINHDMNSYKIKQVFHIVFSLVFVLLNLPMILVLMIIFQPFVFLLFYLVKSSMLMWICWLLCLGINTMLKFIDISEYLEGYNEMDLFLTVTCMFWMNLKCFSYLIDKFKEKDKELKRTEVDLSEYFAYCLYLPTLFGGPFISFDDYIKCLTDARVNSAKKFKKLLKSLLRIGFWAIFIEFALHFIYVNPMLYQIEHVKTFDSWTFYGYGYAMGQYFHLKYVVLYGFSLAFAEFDGIPVPARPKCIGRIHVYSDMWKHFDRGFYIFLVRYLYIPLMGNNRSLLPQLFASFVCFLFVYVWHGIATFILIWTTINLFTITIEKCFKLLVDSEISQNLMQEMNVTLQWKQRLHGIVAAPLLAISAMSNSYFFAGKEVGDAFFAQFFASDLSAKITFFFLLYFCCQVSIETRKWERVKDANIKHDKFDYKISHH